MSTKNVKAGLSKANVNAIAGAIGTATLNRLVPIFSTAVAYEKGQYTNYNNQLYRFTADKSAGAWDSSKVESASLNDLIHDVNEAVATINDKANVDGNYPTLTAGLSDNLNTKIVDNDVNAYLSRPTGGLDTESGNNCKEKGIVGGSIGFNQLFNPSNLVTIPVYGITPSFSNGKLTLSGTTSNESNSWGRFYQFNVQAGHKYLLNAIGSYSATSSDMKRIAFLSNDWSKIEDVTDNRQAKITNFGGNYSGNVNVCFGPLTNQTYDIQVNFFIVDLTAMFGSTIADYIYTLEIGQAGAGVAWFKRYFNKPYYPYTAIGGFIHVKTSGKESVGFNQWDEEWELGTYDNSTGQPVSNNTRIRAKNDIPVLPNTTYYANVVTNRIYLDASKNVISFDWSYAGTFTTPSNCAYIRVYFGSSYGTTYNNDICINFHYDGERDGEYEPYRKETYTNDNVELIGIPKKDDQGNLYYEGNVYRPDGTIDEKYGIVDLGTLNWSDPNENGWVLSNGLRSIIKKPASASTVFDGACAKYILGSAGYVWNNDERIGCDDNGDIVLRSAAFVGLTNTQVKTALDGIYLIYPLATPTQSSANPYPETQWVDNWGTEKRIDTRDIPIPVGHDTDYPLDLKSKLEIMPSSPSADGDYVVNSASGVNTYVALSSWLADNGYVKLTNITGYDATKTQTLKNISGTLTWVDDE